MLHLLSAALTWPLPLPLPLPWVLEYDSRLRSHWYVLTKQQQWKPDNQNNNENQTITRIQQTLSNYVALKQCAQTDMVGKIKTNYSITQYALVDLQKCSNSCQCRYATVPANKCMIYFLTPSVSCLDNSSGNQHSGVSIQRLMPCMMPSAVSTHLLFRAAICLSTFCFT